MGKKLNLYFVLGGAVSAGAYTAGVIDFFMLRLKEYMAKDKKDRDYNIQIKAITGTSAGGMCGSIFLHGLAQGYPGVPEHSSLFQTWVKDIDISVLSEMDDLTKCVNPNALLNGNALIRLADKIFDQVPSMSDIESYNFVANDCKLVLSVTDTVGKSYEIDFVNDTSEKSYFITNHRDYYYFTLSQPGKEYIELSNKEAWNTLKKVTLATGAFPIGLPPVKLARPSSISKNNNIPGKPFNISRNTHEYYAIDGGVVDNEPFGRLIDIIEDDLKDGGEPVIILIDPFPSKNLQTEKNTLGIQIQRLYTVFRNQSAYKPDEIKEFQRLKDKGIKCYSIIPKQSSNSNVDAHLAGSYIGAFSGFIHEKYRYFDYQLGLRNCQKFLQGTFKLFNKLPEHEEIPALEWPCIKSKEYRAKTKALDIRLSKIVKTFLKGRFWKMAGRVTVRYFKRPSRLMQKPLEEQQLVVK